MNVHFFELFVHEFKLNWQLFLETEGVLKLKHSSQSR